MSTCLLIRPVHSDACLWANTLANFCRLPVGCYNTGHGL
ncbi:hypothetical protein SLEP1_g22320 [Rubroshorea leprosula]|uniref:Uncharacterized protein n=1 Tax=Rubroshorea leprosula TaxID=152421 RepID=A0AAV5JE60_9ROSI|nr:hypothetical protein SLEP1_g22320 [Rubroshorea leprosula]